MAAKKREDIRRSPIPKPRRQPSHSTVRQQKNNLQDKGFIGLFKDIIPEEADTVELVRQHRASIWQREAE